MTNKQRLDLIERYILEHKYADLHTLAKEFSISLSTVRRALNDLETQGTIRRHHGGASRIEDEPSGGYDFITQDDRQSDDKHAIAAHIVRYIQPGMTVMLDGGTTTYTVARQLIGKHIIVITNSLPIAALFNEVSTAESIVTGGTVYNRLGVLIGPVCEANIREMHADIAILGGAGVTEEGIWNSNAMIVSYQKCMMRAADRTFYCIDGTKMGRRALALATPFSPRFTLVSSREPEDRILQAARTAGCKCEVAAPAESSELD